MKANKIIIIINKPIKEVFQFTTNPKNTHLWAHFISEEVSSEYPPKIGTIYKSRRENGNWSEMKVVGFKEDKEFVLSSLDEKLFVKYTYHNLDNNKTKIEYSDWMIGKKFKSPVTKDVLGNLKKVMEI